MHQDEHNQEEQPEPVDTSEATDQPADLPAHNTPVADADPALAVSAPGTVEPVQASFAEMPVESVDAAPSLDTVHEAGTPETHFADQMTERVDEGAAETSAQPEPAPAFEPPAYASPSWSSSDLPDAAQPGPLLDFTQASPDWAPGTVSVASVDYSPTPESGSAGAFDGLPGPPPVWVAPPNSDAPAEGVAAGSRPYERPAEPHIEMPQGGPNWMLAFVCAWAAFTSFMEAPVAYAAKETMINGSSVTLTAGDRLYGGLGFALLGLGLLLFGIEALLWGRRRRGVSALLSIGLPVLVSLGGIVCLVLSHYPGSRI